MDDKSEQIYPLGCMHLNRLRDIKMFKEVDFVFSSVGTEYVESDESDEEDEEDKNGSEGEENKVVFDYHDRRSNLQNQKRV